MANSLFASLTIFPQNFIMSSDAYSSLKNKIQYAIAATSGLNCLVFYCLTFRECVLKHARDNTESTDGCPHALMILRTVYIVLLSIALCIVIAINIFEKYDHMPTCDAERLIRLT